MLCLDSYALWEIQLGNPKFAAIMEKDFIVADWTLVEFYKTILREHNLVTADYWLRKLTPFCKKVELGLLIKAVQLQHRNKKRNLSLFDCVGYMFAVENNMQFVTGDKEFRNVPGVVFIQK